MARLKTILQRFREGLRAADSAPGIVAPKKIEGDDRGRFTVLVVKIDHLGDLVTAIPALKLLRSAWINADITLLCAASLADFARSLQVVDRVVGANALLVEGRTSLVDEPVVLALRQATYDVAIDLRHDGDTREILHAFSARFMVGYASGRSTPRLDIELPELEKSARRRSARGVTNRARLSILIEAAIASIRVPGARPEALAMAEDHAKSGRMIAIAPSARSPIKMWRTERWIALCRRLIERGFEVVLVGDAQDRETCAAIAAAVPGASLVNRAGEMTLLEAVNAITNSTLFVGLDTGLAHVAASVGSPAVVLFSGHADHDVWAPDGPNVSVLRNDVPCAPCHATRMAQCLFDHRCMDLPLEFVWQVASEKLNSAEVHR